MPKTISDILNERFSKIILAQPIDKERGISKVLIRPITIKGQPAFQREEFRGAQTFHTNMSMKETAQYLETALTQFF